MPSRFSYLRNDPNDFCSVFLPCSLRKSSKTETFQSVLIHTAVTAAAVAAVAAATAWSRQVI